MELKEEHQQTPISILSCVKLIGYYLDHEIWEYVELEDGRFFQFESIGVQRFSGAYATDDPYGTYILIYPNLLYREVKKN